jgi:hypothetical protein
MITQSRTLSATCVKACVADCDRMDITVLLVRCALDAVDRGCSMLSQEAGPRAGGANLTSSIAASRHDR